MSIYIYAYACTNVCVQQPRMAVPHRLLKWDVVGACVYAYIHTCTYGMHACTPPSQVG